MEISRERKLLFGGILGLVLVVSAILAPRTPQVSIPTAAEIDSIQLVFYSENSNPKPFLLDSSKTKANIAQLVQWIDSAKSMGYEKSSPSKNGKDSIELVIKLVNHNEMVISGVWLPDTVTEPNGKTVSELKRSNEYIDIQSSDTTGANNVYATSGVAYRSIRYYSPKLANWLNNSQKMS